MNHIHAAAAWGPKLNLNDVAVAGAAVATTVFPAWWELAGQFAIDGMRGLILAGTVAYVLFRAANEIRTFFSSKNQKD